MITEDNIAKSLPALELLELLSDGGIHSGQDLAVLLGVSRTAVWKQLAKLKALGFLVQPVSGKGYSILGGIELLSERRILDVLEPSILAQLSSLIILKSVDSTNAFLLRQAAAEKIMVCLAECQTAGRGRRGRTWISPFAKNIYLSIKMTSEAGIGVFEGLSLAVGVAISRALKSLGIPDVRLKWPNDVLWQERKLAGVLIEVVGDLGGACNLVVGVGLNVSNNEEMRANINQPWVSVQDIMQHLNLAPVGRNKVASVLLSEIIPLLSQYETQSFSLYREEWESLNAYKGQWVDVQMGAANIAGILMGVNDTGALIVRTTLGEQLFHGGEVSLRVGGR
jgi:BirA family transcriptional regulator, biotin operon repressor / biotin---[acetyl-CoA-carboxylase] ligase